MLAQPAIDLSSFDGKGESFQSYAIAVELWRLVTSLGIPETCTCGGSSDGSDCSRCMYDPWTEKLLDHNEVGTLLTALKKDLGPGALADEDQDGAEFPKFRKSA